MSLIEKEGMGIYLGIHIQGGVKVFIGSKVSSKCSNVLLETRWIGIVDKALASHSWGQGLNPAETRG